MKKTTPYLALAVIPVLLVLAAPAAAKEVTAARICGAGGCVDVRDHSAIQAFHEGGTPVEAPDRGSPWYRATLTVQAEDARDTFSVVFVPSARLIRSGEKVDGLYLWTPISADAAERIGAAAGALEPFPASKLAGTGPEGRHEVVVQGVVRPAARVEDEESDGFSEAWVGAAGGLLLVGAGALGLRRRRRNGQ